MKTSVLGGVAAMVFASVAGCAPNYDSSLDYPPTVGPDAIVVGSNIFSYPNDVERIDVAGFPDRIGAIAVRPLNGDARCSRVTASFANGRSRDLDIGRADYLAAGREYWIDLPGFERNVMEIEMACQPVGPDPVRVQVLASR